MAVNIQPRSKEALSPDELKRLDALTVRYGDGTIVPHHKVLQAYLAVYAEDFKSELTYNGLSPVHVSVTIREACEAVRSGLKVLGLSSPGQTLDVTVPLRDAFMTDVHREGTRLAQKAGVNLAFRPANCHTVEQNQRIEAFGNALGFNVKLARGARGR